MYKIIISGLCLIISLSAFAGNEPYVIKPKDSLAQVLRSLGYGDSYRELLPFIDQIVELNPQVFSNGNPNFLESGTTILLPENPNVQAPEPVSLPKPIPAPVPMPQPAPESPPKHPAGTIETIKGTTDILRDNDKLTVDRQEPIYVEDIILTHNEAHAEILLMDDSIISLGPNTELVVNEFTFDKNRQTNHSPPDSLIASLNKGVMRIITGLIGKSQQNQFAIKSAFSATIGIRGTDFTVRTCLEVELCNELYGVSAAVMDGGIQLKNNLSSVSLDKNEFAQVKSANESPSKAPLPDGFFDLNRSPKEIRVNLAWWEKAFRWLKSKI